MKFIDCYSRKEKRRLVRGKRRRSQILVGACKYFSVRCRNFLPLLSFLIVSRIFPVSCLRSWPELARTQENFSFVMMFPKILRRKLAFITFCSLFPKCNTAKVEWHLIQAILKRGEQRRVVLYQRPGSAIL